ncbi:MAG TPA: redoxin domain-containing protein [Oligoflexus sp.]|uniref:TlpA family protein disulfide reductase n=1 Tax=Oligoflexus sp. TaxID=1971216 RepID=UPI002D2BCE47|nr:redoxin domain-containing protein [Oligoflexus sp.]HYX33325.1 redoxin domain-containing protein [Oligoflexus sp.]
MIARVFFIMTLLLLGVNVKAADAKEAAHGAGPEGDTKDSKNGAQTRADHYVHRWVPFPAFKATNLDRRETVAISPSEGRATVLVFLASWCVPCQQQIREFKRIEDKYRDHFTDFVYIFAHDTETDARGFSNVYKIGNNAMMASANVLEAFHQPELPSFYVADRYKWLVLRRINTQKQDLDELDKFLSLHTAL